MKKLWILAASAAMVISLTGCIAATSTLETYPPDQAIVAETGGRALAAAKVSNRGVYIFYYLPIWSGKPHVPNLYRFRMFKDYLSKGYMTSMLYAAQKKVGGEKIENARYMSHCNGWWGLGILWMRTMHAEATIIGDPAKDKAKDKKKK